MNEMVWLPEEDRYMAKPIYKEGLLTACSSLHFLPIICIHGSVPMLTMPVKATVVTFIYGKVRIVQATCNPSETYPTLSLTLRAICSLGKDNYNKKVAFNVLKWIFCPSEPAKELAMRGKSRSSYRQAWNVWGNIFLGFAGTRLGCIPRDGSRIWLFFFLDIQDMSVTATDLYFDGAYVLQQ